MTRILVIEDHRNLLRSVTKSLREIGWEVEGAESLAAAELAGGHFDVVVLDLMLPDGSGLDWLASQRAQGNAVLILVLTARDAIEDRVIGLNMGADDYLIKPFSLDELVARIRALLRRSDSGRGSLIMIGDLTVNLLTREALCRDQPLSLQNRQFELLTYLIRNAEQVITRGMIAHEVWKESTATWTNVIEVQINHLRKKLDAAGSSVTIRTVRNQGYVIGHGS
jgi:DNA-binding response OmpR family regulator